MDTPQSRLSSSRVSQELQNTREKKLRPKLLLLNDTHTHTEFSISIKGLESTDAKISCIEEIRVLQNGQPLL